MEGRNISRVRAFTVISFIPGVLKYREHNDNTTNAVWNARDLAQLRSFSEKRGVDKAAD